MEVIVKGSLRVIRPWEEMLAALPQHAEGPEGLGLVWENEVAARTVGQDPTIKQGWRLGVYKGVEFTIPDEAEVAEVTSGPAGPYTLVKIDQVAVHLRNGLKITDGRRVVGDVHVCARVFWPKGADEHLNGRAAWRNYLLYVDMVRSDEPLRHDLVVHPEGVERAPVLMLGAQQAVEGEQGEDLVITAWSTRSTNWHYGTEGSDQCLCLYPR